MNSNSVALTVLLIITCILSVASIAMLIFLLYKIKNINSNSNNSSIDEINKYLSELPDKLNTTIFTIENIQKGISQLQVSFTQEIYKMISDNSNRFFAASVENQKTIQGIIDKKIEDSMYKINSILNESKQKAQESAQRTNETLDKLNSDINERLKTIFNLTQSELNKIKDTNEKKFDEIRKSVDDQIRSNIKNALDNSLKAITAQINVLNNELKTVEDVSKNITSLQQILAGTKSKGIFGEAVLENIIMDILGANLYKKQFQLDKNTKTYIDFAIEFPGKNGNKIYLPIDAKFQEAPYSKILKAREMADKKGLEEAINELKTSVKRDAGNIGKYLESGETTDFAVMFVPTEGIYAELASIPGFISEIRQVFKVLITGPNTIVAFLSSLRIGFQTIELQKSSKEVLNALRGFVFEFDKFSELIDKAERKIDEGKKVLSEMTAKKNKIQSKLTNIRSLGENKEED